MDEKKPPHGGLFFTVERSDPVRILEIRCRFRIRDVIAFRYAARCDGRATGAVAAYAALGARATLGDAVRRFGGVADRLLGTRPTLLEHDFRIGVTARVVGRALAGAASPDALTLPARLGQGGVTLLESTGRVLEPLFLVANRDAVDDRIDAGNAARNGDRVPRLGFVLDPSRELDDAVADRPDVDRALRQRRIVAERLEHPLLETFVVFLGLELVLFDVLELVGVARRRISAESFGGARTAQLRFQSTESAHPLR